MNVHTLFGEAEIFSFNRYDGLQSTIKNDGEIAMTDFDVALLDPGVPPVSPSSSREERIDMISTIISALRNDCSVLVLTGSYSEAESKVMLQMGVSKYLSKDSLDLMQLRNHIDTASGSPQAVGPDTEMRTERFFSGLTEKERIGLAVHQKMYDENLVSRALDLDVESIRRYVTRAKKRERDLINSPGPQ
ncbi:hypothetical protein R0J92_15995 [Tritonibacter sp. SIMBA_163]|uniref:Response regulatory domain-containing protein n=2 Tax=Paracoccaceae TaxID=31989 RepID=A0ABZ0HPW3_TRISK|nr:hypothetical protein R1T40_21440 [Tritonibacter scottomollicae]